MTLEEKKRRVKEEYETLKEQWGRLDNSYFTWSKTRRALGDCRQEGLIVPVFRVRFSLPYLEVNSIDVALEVLRHECAHVLAMMEGCYDHGQIWKKWALLLDAPPSYACKIEGLKTPKSKYELFCENSECTNDETYKKSRLRYASYICNSCEHPVTIKKNW